MDILLIILSPGSDKVLTTCKGLNKWFLKERIEKVRKKRTQEGEKEKRKERGGKSKPTSFLLCTSPPHPAAR